MSKHFLHQPILTQSKFCDTTYFSCSYILEQSHLLLRTTEVSQSERKKDEKGVWQNAQKNRWRFNLQEPEGKSSNNRLQYVSLLVCMSKNWEDEDESCSPLSLPMVDDPTHGVPDRSKSIRSSESGKVHSCLHFTHLSAVSNLSHADSPAPHQCNFSVFNVSCVHLCTCAIFCNYQFARSINLYFVHGLMQKAAQILQHSNTKTKRPHQACPCARKAKTWQIQNVQQKRSWQLVLGWTSLSSLPVHLQYQKKSTGVQHKKKQYCTVWPIAHAWMYSTILSDACSIVKTHYFFIRQNDTVWFFAHEKCHQLAAQIRSRMSTKWWRWDVINPIECKDAMVLLLSRSQEDKNLRDGNRSWPAVSKASAASSTSNCGFRGRKSKKIQYNMFLFGLAPSSLGPSLYLKGSSTLQ